MKKLISAVLSLGLSLLLCVNVLAAGSAEIVRAFVYDGTLYTYVSMDGMEKPVTKAEARLGGQTVSASGRLETVRQAGAPITWLLLVDNSTSMPAFREEADRFAAQLAQSAGENTKFILASFGDSFQVVGEDVPAEELAGEMESLPFDERVTRLHTAIGQALDYFEGLPRARNELRCMVILSDGVQYDPQGGVPYEELLERVGRSDVMLHSVGLGDDREALDSLGRLALASGGLHQAAGELPVEDIADALTESGNALFVTGFDLSGCTSPGGPEEVSVTFAAGSELICRAETRVELPELTGTPAVQEEPSAQTPQEGQRPAGGGEASGGGGAGAPASTGWSVPVLAIAAGAVVLTAAAAVVLKSKKTAPPSVSDAPAGERSGIYMRLAVLRGALANGQTGMELELREELTIGSGPDCGVVLQDGAVFPRHARLFVSEGAVCLEGLDGAGGIQVNGAPVQQERRLYSGDEIAIGGTAFQLKF